MASDDLRALFTARRGSTVPALWDGERLRTGKAVIVAWLGRVGT